MSKSNENCFACGRALKSDRRQVTTLDDQRVFVGIDCFSKVVTAGSEGYQPPLGGPKLYLLKWKFQL